MAVGNRYTLFWKCPSRGGDAAKPSVLDEASLDVAVMRQHDMRHLGRRGMRPGDDGDLGARGFAREHACRRVLEDEAIFGTHPKSLGREQIALRVGLPDRDIFTGHHVARHRNTGRLEPARGEFEGRRRNDRPPFRRQCLQEGDGARNFDNPLDIGNLRLGKNARLLFRIDRQAQRAVVSTARTPWTTFMSATGSIPLRSAQDPQTLSTTAIELSSVPSMSKRRAAKFFVKIAEEDVSKPGPLDFEFTCFAGRHNYSLRRRCTMLKQLLSARLSAHCPGCRNLQPIETTHGYVVVYRSSCIHP